VKDAVWIEHQPTREKEILVELACLQLSEHQVDESL